MGLRMSNCVGAGSTSTSAPDASKAVVEPKRGSEVLACRLLMLAEGHTTSAVLQFVLCIAVFLSLPLSWLAKPIAQLLSCLGRGASSMIPVAAELKTFTSPSP